MRAFQRSLCSAHRRVLSALTAATLTLAYVPAASADAPPEDDAGTDDAPGVEGEDQAAPAGDDADDETADETGDDETEGDEAEGDEEPAEGDETEGDEEPAEGDEAEGEETEGDEAEATEDEAAEDEAETPEPIDAATDAEEPVTEMEAPVPAVPAEPEDERGPPPMYGEREATGKGLLIAGGAVTAGGLAFLGASIAVTRCDPTEPGCPYGDQDLFLIPSALAVTGVGAMLLVAGGINMVRYKKWQRGELKTVFAPAPMRNGAGVTASGRF